MGIFYPTLSEQSAVMMILLNERMSFIVIIDLCLNDGHAFAQQ